jgi:surface antigen
MQTLQRIWQYMQRHQVASIAVGHVCVLLVMVTVFLWSGLGANLLGAFARSCASGDQSYVVHGGDTLGAIAIRYNTTVQKLASYNQITNPNLIYVGQTICVQGKSTTTQAPVQGTGNYFPYGQCTWWASQRYREITGVFVPWTTQSNAWQWTDRAYDFHWKVSHTPKIGAIVDLQAWVQGAGGLGHVAIVEEILDNGHVIASNMNWGATPQNVVNVEFVPNDGVTFITFS